MIQTKYQKCIEACESCVINCTQCANACLNEEKMSHLKKCIQLNLECVNICNASVLEMSLDGSFSKEICVLCVNVCRACAEECEKHAGMGIEHCKICAEVCRNCEKACKEMSQAA